MRQLIVGLGAVLILSAGSPSLAQDPPPQFSVEDLQREFSRPNQAKSCEDQGMVTGAGGRCEQKPVTRGFSLTAPKQAAPAKVKGQPTPPSSSQARRRPSGTAVATAAAPAPRVQGRDLLITFANNSSTLTPQARSNAKVFADALRTPQLNSLRFEIAGHTNATGARAANQSLSQQRAQALVDYLVSLGVDPSRFEAKGFGYDRPINAANPRAAENRRVEARRLN